MCVRMVLWAKKLQGSTSAFHFFFPMVSILIDSCDVLLCVFVCVCVYTFIWLVGLVFFRTFPAFKLSQVKETNDSAPVFS